MLEEERQEFIEKKTFFSFLYSSLPALKSEDKICHPESPHPEGQNSSKQDCLANHARTELRACWSPLQGQWS